MYVYVYIYGCNNDQFKKEKERERPKFEGELEEVCGRVWKEKMKQRNIIIKL